MKKGSFFIEVDMDTGNFDKKYNDLLRRLEKEEASLKVKTDALEKTEEHLKNLKEEFERFKKEAEEPIDTGGLPIEDDVVDELIGKGLAYYETEIDRATAKVEKQKGAVLKQQQAYDEMAQKAKEYEYEMLKAEKAHNNIPQKLNKINNSLKGIIKSVSKWALAIFGIRGAYMLVRQAINTIAQEDESIALKIEYIKYVIATSLKPIVEWIVNAAYKLLSLFGGIVKAIFGVDIFAKATADNFAKAKSSANGLKKTLAGFDEMNVINGSSSGLIGDIKGALSDLGDLSTEVENFSKKVKKWFLGPGNKNIGEAIKNSIKNFPKWLEEIFSPIYDYVIKPYLVDPILESVEMLRPVWQPIVDAFKTGVNDMKAAWQPLIDYIKPNVIDPIEKEFEKSKTHLLSLWENTFKTILPIIGPYINDIIYAINNIFGIFGVKLDYLEWDIEQTSDETEKTVEGALNDTSKKSDKTGKDIKQNIGGALTDTKNKAEDISKPTYQIKFNNESINAANNWINNLWNKLKDLTLKTWKVALGLDVSNGSFGYGGGGGFRAKGGIYYPSKLPKLASGGIINRPGPGVPYHGATIGERGAEAVVPLTDSQQMELLGEAIGKYITINANITNTMNGRVISRELQKINNESDFAFNR